MGNDVSIALRISDDLNKDLAKVEAQAKRSGEAVGRELAKGAQQGAKALKALDTSGGLSRGFLEDFKQKGQEATKQSDLLRASLQGLSREGFQALPGAAGPAMDILT